MASCWCLCDGGADDRSARKLAQDHPALVRALLGKQPKGLYVAAARAWREEQLAKGRIEGKNSLGAYAYVREDLLTDDDRAFIASVEASDLETGAE